MRNSVHDAVISRSTKHLEELIAQGAPVDKPDAYGETALGAAFVCGYDDYCIMLCKAGAKNLGEGDASPLIKALKAEDISCIKKLVTYGLDINSLTPEGKTMLEYACHRPTSLHFFKELIDLGADVNGINSKGEPLLNAIDDYPVPEPVMQLFLEHGAKIDYQKLAASKSFGSIISSKERKDYFTLVKEKLNQGVIWDADSISSVISFLTPGLFPVGVSAKSNDLLRLDLQALHLVLENGFPVNARSRNGDTLLVAYCYHGNVEGVRMLINAGADVNRAGTMIILSWMYPVVQAANSGNIELMRILVNAGADLSVTETTSFVFDGYEETALNKAVHKFYPDVTKLILSHMKISKQIISSALTGFLEPVKYMDNRTKEFDERITETMKLLIQAGGKIKQFEPELEEILFMAIRFNVSPAVTALVELGINLDYVDPETGKMPLIYAVLQPDSEENRAIVQVLYEKQIHKLTDRPEQKELLETAISHGHLYLVKQMIEDGISTDVMFSRNRKLRICSTTL